MAPPIQAVCRTDSLLWADAAGRQGRLQLARLNGNRPVAALARAEETSVPPQLASNVHGRHYVAFADRDGFIRLAEVVEDRRHISSQGNPQRNSRALFPAGCRWPPCCWPGTRTSPSRPMSQPTASGAC